MLGGGSEHIVEVIMERIKTYGDHLRRWNKLEFGHAQTTIHKVQIELQLLQQYNPDLIDHEQMKEARNEVHKWLEKDEIRQHQHFRILWLSVGDRNSLYFHRKASKR